jgi:hypothetical protein
LDWIGFTVCYVKIKRFMMFMTLVALKWSHLTAASNKYLYRRAIGDGT